MEQFFVLQSLKTRYASQVNKRNTIDLKAKKKKFSH